MAHREDPIIVAIAQAIDHVRKGNAGAAVDTLEAADPDGFMSTYAIAGGIARLGITSGPVTVTSFGSTPGQDEYGASLGAFIAAAGNGDVEGARAVYFADAFVTGEMMGDLLIIASQLVDGASGAVG
jgi:hypothetical protein